MNQIQSASGNGDCTMGLTSWIRRGPANYGPANYRPANYRSANYNGVPYDMRPILKK